MQEQKTSRRLSQSKEAYRKLKRFKMRSQAIRVDVGKDCIAHAPYYPEAV